MLLVNSVLRQFEGQIFILSPKRIGQPPTFSTACYESGLLCFNAPSYLHATGDVPDLTVLPRVLVDESAAAS